MRELDLELPDRRTLHAYDTGRVGADELVVVWHHGTPNVGTPPEPLFPTSDRLGIRWIGYDRPGYGGSTRRLGRDVASAAAEVRAVVDTLGVDRFAVMGHSGGGPHALACGALLGERVRGVVVAAGLAPYDAPGLDYFGGMAPAGVASLRAAHQGPEMKERHEASATDEDIGLIAADHAALAGEWAWFNDIVRRGLEGGLGGLVDDDIAYVTPWGFTPAGVAAPALLLHGQGDRVVPSAHAEWLRARLPSAELWLRPEDGHLSVLSAAPAALEWLAEHAA